MRRGVSRATLLLPILVGGCQVIASLEVPTYEASVATATGVSGSSTGGTGTGGSGGNLPCSPSADPDTAPPCPEHIRMWLIGDRDDLVSRDENGFVTEWRDASSVGWTATAAPGTVEWTTRPYGQHVVRMDDAGMKLDPHGVPIDLRQVGIFVNATLDEVPHGDGTHPYSTADFVCLRPQTQKAPIRVHSGILADGGNLRLLAGAFDGDLENSLHIGAARAVGNIKAWGYRYACDADCEATMSGLRRAGFVDGEEQIQPNESTDTETPSLDPAPFASWDGVWTEGNLGAFCGNGGGGIKADFAEVLVYDAYLEDDLVTQLKHYFTARWGN